MRMKIRRTNQRSKNWNTRECTGGKKCHSYFGNHKWLMNLPFTINKWTDCHRDVSCFLFRVQGNYKVTTVKPPTLASSQQKAAEDFLHSRLYGVGSCRTTSKHDAKFNIRDTKWHFLIDWSMNPILNRCKSSEGSMNKTIQLWNPLSCQPTRCCPFKIRRRVPKAQPFALSRANGVRQKKHKKTFWDLFL